MTDYLFTDNMILEIVKRDSKKIKVSFFDACGSLWMAVFLQLHNEKSNIDESLENTPHINDTPPVLLSAYNIDVYIFFIRSNYNRRALNPAYGQSGFRSGKITRIVLHVR